MTTAPDTLAVRVRRGRQQRSLAHRILRSPLGAASLIYLAAVTLIAIVGPVLVPYDPMTASLQDVFAPPSPEHLLGADSAGRDVLSRLVVATSFSLLGALITVVVAAGVGIPAGLIAGYRGGWFDSLSTWIAGLLLSLPAIVVLLAARAVVGPSLWLVMGIFGVLVSPSYFRVVSSAVQAVRAELYIDAAKVAGLGDARIIGRHILSVVRAPAILMTSGIFAVGIAIQASLDFLGLGDPTMPTWGSMLSEGFRNIYRDPTLLLWPSIAIALTCVAFTLFGTSIRDELERTGDRGRARSAAPWAAPATRPAAPERHDSGHAETDPVLTVSELSVAYDDGESGWTTVVDGVSLNIAKGEIHALIGESGSGKTQTAWSILGLLPQGGSVVAGSIKFHGDELRGLDPHRLSQLRGRHIGYVPQEPLSNLDPSFTIGQQLTEPLRVVLGMNRAAARDRALQLLERVGIVDPQRTYDSYPHLISGGMAQRVLIAGAVACEPDLIIADEPTTALDVTVQAEILDLLRELQSEAGVAMLLVTHNFGVVADLADRISVMRNGSIVETGPTAELFDSPRHDYTKSLFDALLDDAPARGAWTPREVRA
ncbi:dipeptide/oligopeptide/nickel ABC transporter permease/ATP-binding protein [Salinibacterium sp. SYSU T00001]|uniref:dipeptide/oligopeptide/nickel ABC transporter permease/ATP-binding protein n=1 Tax=Homoserinimonas sedimenticola TaxID=2986805 RepID=UPI002236520F|nr:dipeptide/oligopeptide/nickel ABC transporter permease/ATP-binding protein [Salinibacterium sedimenticola]MCW4386117.1 dipeptide/oligopeptide/nickel ABC transporter permease/ATP-binding protein [Salinibacterium sedimenticola]